ncbi:MAG TPA: HDOD domain-containing protein [Syntrophorhabdales bacterium]|nr:HDOD domain-containing protein [Syntrophorhabdales bacterium]
MNQSFVTRKPLLDRNRNIAAYEVSFRDINGLRPDAVPTQSPGEALVVFLSTNSFEQLTGEKAGLISLGPDLLKDHIVALIPKDRAVLGLSDGDPLTNAVLMEQCKNLRQRGYRFCLNHVKHEGSYPSFMQLAEFVKISMTENDRAKIAESNALLKKLPVKLIASDVDTEDEYKYSLGLDFDLFEGSFYYKHSAVTSKSISPSQILLLELSAYLAKDEDMHIVEGIFKKNPELTFGLLKLINSAFFRVQQKITSIRQAIALLGYANLQKWVGLLLFTIDHRDHALNPLVEKVLIRGRMMEMLAERVTGSKTAADGAFITGILSFVNVLFGKPLHEIVDKLSLAPEIREALLQREGVLGNLLAITEDLDDENYSDLEKRFSLVGIRAIDLLSIETKAILEYQASVNDDIPKHPQGKEVN